MANLYKFKIQHLSVFGDTALPSVMRYKNPTPNPLPASDEGAMMYLITKESAVSEYGN